jgi:hypothetical protein
VAREVHGDGGEDHGCDEADQVTQASLDPIRHQVAPWSGWPVLGAKISYDQFPGLPGTCDTRLHVLLTLRERKKICCDLQPAHLSPQVTGTSLS